MEEPNFDEDHLVEILNKKRTSPGFSRVGYDALSCTGKETDGWRISLITLFKKTPGVPSVDQYRPIACQEADYKVFDLKVSLLTAIELKKNYMLCTLTSEKHMIQWRSGPCLGPWNNQMQDLLTRILK
jgi:hypothetical protein